VIFQFPVPVVDCAVYAGGCEETCQKECDAKVKAAKDECAQKQATQYVLFVLNRYHHLHSYHRGSLQCESKTTRPNFSDVFSETVGNFWSKFYTPILRSCLRWTTNLYSVSCNFDEVAPV